MTRGGSPLRREILFLLAIGSMTAGMAIAALDATGVTTRAGDHSNGAIYTSIYLAILLFTLAIAVPFVPNLAKRFGSRPTLMVSVLLASLFWATSGALVLIGVAPVPVLLATAALAGPVAGVLSVLTPLYARAYISGKDMAGAYARLSVAGGVSYAIGAGAGGFVLNVVNPGWGLVARAALGLPFALFALRVSPDVEPTMPLNEGSAWGRLRSGLSTNRDLRRATLLGCGIAAFAAPMVTMIVPIVDSLRIEPLLPGAGILMGAISVGELLSPLVVSRLERDRTELRAAALAALGCALFLAAYGIASLILTAGDELVAWAIVGVGFGAMRYGGRALNIGAATAAESEGNAAEAVAAFVFASSITAPIGVILWGLVINRIAPEAAVLGGAAATALIASLWLRRGVAKPA